MGQVAHINGKDRDHLSIKHPQHTTLGANRDCPRNVSCFRYSRSKEWQSYLWMPNMDNVIKDCSSSFHPIEPNDLEFKNSGVIQLGFFFVRLKTIPNGNQCFVSSPCSSRLEF
ncbi:hypothetical protein M758_10G022400 [Ceratodon purpureus]|uniref:Uncharacterized protein n=1 Tax=Ceratodon purpureus TaxID=3225 RepID=A0A8T0GG26_CERPU|nr:hypothetical protein KC19_10G024200 [Ceratodon purpureus]KAG0602554.1 hypothetical protein M758_10G022400 [Ceratodon purpureus]